VAGCLTCMGLLENMKGRDHLEDLSVDEQKILGNILKT
jgi:hypothetical protein